MSRLLHHSRSLRSFLPLTTLEGGSSRLRWAQQEQHRSFFQGSWQTGSIGSISPENDEKDRANRVASRPLHHPHFQQVRWKRKVGNRFANEVRKPSKKERKEYRRKLAAKLREETKHGDPGSKAGPRRQAIQEIRENMMQDPLDAEPTMDEIEGYDMNHALLDSIVGDTKDCIPTPIPKYLGGMQQTLYGHVADKMEEFRESVDMIGDGKSSKEIVDVSTLELPSDREISLAIRSFRDRFGTRQSPIGLAKALTHLLQDLGVPISACGEFSFNALLSCCRTPSEGRKVLELMNKENQKITAYTWSILTDIYAKVGDYGGCVQVHEEMLFAGIPPTLASYTSLLAACYKVTADNRLPHKNRAEAADVAWEQWKHMYKIGIEPDAMAYGAILRIFAAKGLPERALDVIEEMRTMSVTPTTLCFTSALRAVAKSHETAIRYERGFSRKNMRREEITAHHGNIAKSILVYAEDADVEQDDGFVAALISCAAAAGDLPTAKAIFLAAQIRRLDQFRTIGSKRHIASLRGEGIGNGELLTSGEAGANAPAMLEEDLHEARVKAFREREYGKDWRVHGAILKACANAVAQKSLGTMWQGRENEGYLCENSLRLLKARPLPLYQNRDVPGSNPLSEAFNEETDLKDPGYRGGKRSGRKSGNKSRGVVADHENHVESVDDLGPELAPLVLQDDFSLKPEFELTTPEDIWRKKYGQNEEMLRAVRAAKGFIDEGMYDDDAPLLLENSSSRSEHETPALLAPDEPKEKMYFSYETMKWEKGEPPAESSAKIVKPQSADQASPSRKDEKGKNPAGDMYFSYDTMKWETRSAENSERYAEVENPSYDSDKKESKEEALYFDSDEMKWKTKKTKPEVPIDQFKSSSDIGDDMEAPKEDASQTALVTTEESIEKLDEDETFGEDFDLFYSELQKELDESGSAIGKVDEQEARAFFSSFQADRALDEKGERPRIENTVQASDALVETSENISEMSESSVQGPAFNPSVSGDSSTVKTVELPPQAQTTTDEVTFEEVARDMTAMEGEGGLDEDLAEAEGTDLESTLDNEDQKKYKNDLEELRDLLPMFSDRRLKNILKVFYKELGNPSLIDLVLAVRETMPDYVTNTWLKKMSKLTAGYIIADADRKDLVSQKFMNKILDLKASLGSIDEAMTFHDVEFKARNMEPCSYSDRIVIQMLLKQKRFSRALSFKGKVEAESRSVDLLGYGSLIDHCARRDQLGTALMLLRECIDIHGAPPNEASIRQFRVLCRRARIDDNQEILEMIGRDPLEWLHRGQKLKRNRSRKANRNVTYPREAALKG